MARAVVEAEEARGAERDETGTSAGLKNCIRHEDLTLWLLQNDSSLACALLWCMMSTKQALEAAMILVAVHGKLESVKLERKESSDSRFRALGFCRLL